MRHYEISLSKCNTYSLLTELPWKRKSVQVNHVFLRDAVKYLSLLSYVGFGKYYYHKNLKNRLLTLKYENEIRIPT